MTEKQGIQGVIFDLGNTLSGYQGDLDATQKTGAAAVGEWYAKKKRIKLDQTALAAVILRLHKKRYAEAQQTEKELLMSDTIRLALREIEAPARAEGFAEEATRQFFAAEKDGFFLMPHTIETLKQLQAQKLKLGILSNATDDALVQRMVNQLGLRPYFSPVFSSAGLGWRKPNARPFQLIAKRWQLSPEQIVMIGDQLATDVQGAKNAGMRSILFTAIEHPDNAGQSVSPDAVTNNMATLPDIITAM